VAEGVSNRMLVSEIVMFLWRSSFSSVIVVVVAHFELEIESKKPRRGSILSTTTAAAGGAGNSSSRASIISSATLESGETKLIRAEKSLDNAKTEAQSTLAPILERMRRGRRIRSTEQVLKRLSATLEYPHKMSVALENNDYDEVPLLSSGGWFIVCMTVSLLIFAGDKYLFSSIQSADVQHVTENTSASSLECGGCHFITQGQVCDVLDVQRAQFRVGI
jgi:hypothetical protein